MKQPLYGKTLSELSVIVAQLGMPRFTAAQIAGWLYKKGATDIAQMSDLSLKNRELLTLEYCVGLYAPVNVAESEDGTKKYLFRIDDSNYIESAYIPDGDRATLCVSSQAGCKMGCKFCMTGQQGFARNLTACEILNQVASIPERESLTNVVYMGMGEPLDNFAEVLRSLEVLTSDWGYGWSPGRITLSTIGVLPTLEEFLDSTKVNLAVSLHNPFADQREDIMPAQKAFPIAQVMDILRRYDFSHQRRVSFEYIVLKGMNDTPQHIKELCRLLDGVKCRINLICFHKIPSSPYVSPDALTMVRFRDALSKKGIVTTIRSSRGEDIQAACGLLSTARMQSEGK